jgi:crotonobetainyl-CoA:carnitine CoA-transferase CaiB-like acyl-CoA transferase
MGFGENTDLRRELQTVFRTKTRAEWIELAVQNDVALCPAYSSVTEAVFDPHLQQREIFVRGSHPSVGEFDYIGRPAIVEGDEQEIRHPAPALGEHTDELLAELGYGSEEQKALRTEAVV